MAPIKSDGYGDGSGYGENIEKYWAASIETIISKQKAEKIKKSGAILAYWRSTKDGEPANGGSGTKAKVGLIEEIPGPIKICTKNALHGTLNPPKWKGEKIWIVALYPPVVWQDDKCASLKREFICEAGFTL